VQQVTETHVAEKFNSDAVSHTIDHFRPIIRWINVNAERAPLPIREGLPVIWAQSPEDP
jgi:hypothetical protein